MLSVNSDSPLSVSFLLLFTDSAPQAFGIPLSQVIANDRLLKQRLDPQQEEPWDPNDLVTSFFHLTSTSKRLVKELSSSNSSLSSTSETPNELSSPNTPEPLPRTRRRVSSPRRPRPHAAPFSSEGLSLFNANAEHDPVL